MSRFSESVTVDGKPVGRIMWDSGSGRLAFIPTVTPSPVSDRNWASIDELRAAIVEAYRQSRNGAA